MAWRTGGNVDGDRVYQHSDAVLGGRAVRSESSGRNWAEIGIGLAAAFALIAMYSAGIWALVVLGEALT
jgi:hypothetical protein